MTKQDDDKSVIDLLTQPNDKDHLNQEQDICGDCQEVDLEGTPAHSFEDKSKICINISIIARALQESRFE